MPLALPMTDKVSQASAGATTYRWNTAKFGDGYEQRVPDGINYQTRKWTINYDNLSTTDYTTLQTFLDNAGQGQYFTWTPPGYAVALKWVIDGNVNINAKSGNIYSVSFPARQVFDI